MYCLGRVLDPDPEKKHLERVSKHLKNVCSNLGLDKIKMPVSVEDIPKIEKEFKLTINLFGYKKNIYPIRTTMERYDKHMDLLYIEDKIEETSHYVWIKNFNKLMNKITKNCRKKHFCKWCINHFTTEKMLKEHMENCIVINKVQKSVYPTEGSKVKFSDIKNMIACPFVIYADIEALLKSETKDSKLNNNKSYTVKKQKHEACSFGYTVVCHDNEKLSKPYKMFRGKNAITKFFEALFDEEKEIIEHMKRFKKNTDIIMTQTQIKDYNQATTCYICDGKYTPKNRKVRDHCHVSGKYRGAAHDKCNLQLKLSTKIPVIFHNLKNYDSHHLMQKLGQFGKNINIIPNNMEKYLSFSIGTVRKEWDYKHKKMVDKESFNLKFIDSLNFMNSSLSNLVENLKKSGLDKFKYTNQVFGPSTEILTRKGVYPYSFMNKWKKFKVDPGKLRRKDF